MAVELVPLAVATFEMKTPLLIGATPTGTRVVGEVNSGRFVGDRLAASMVGTAAADWLLVGSDGIGKVDVRLTLQTDDGAMIYVTYLGRFHTATMTAFTSPLFDVADERYTWLNAIQAVARGVLEGQTLTYEMYEVR